MPLEAPAEAGTGDLGVDELPDYREEVIQGGQDGLAQFHHQKLLRRRERGLQTMRGMRAIFHRVPALPAADCVFGDAQLIRQCRDRQRRSLDGGARPTWSWRSCAGESSGVGAP